MSTRSASAASTAALVSVCAVLLLLSRNTTSPDTASISSTVTETSSNDLSTELRSWQDYQVAGVTYGWAVRSSNGDVSDITWSNQSVEFDGSWILDSFDDAACSGEYAQVVWTVDPSSFDDEGVHDPESGTFSILYDNVEIIVLESSIQYY